MGELKIDIAKDFTRTPGPREIREGFFSGEEFYEKILKHKFKEAISTKQKLFIVLDGTAGYATSFLDGSFGRLQRANDKINVLEFLNFQSQEDPFLIDEIKEYVNESKAH